MVIAKVKKKAYRESRAEACNSLEELWKAIRQAKIRAPRQPCLPNIQKSMERLATEPKEKIGELKKVLLPIPQFMDFSDIQGFEYPNRLEMPKITQHKVLQIIRHLWSRKAPRPNQIPNKVLKVIVREICHCLEQIFNDSLALLWYIYTLPLLRHRHYHRRWPR